MSEPWMQDEPEDDDAQPAAEEPDRPADLAVPELDDDWED
jgi:hypothetical protein